MSTTIQTNGKERRERKQVMSDQSRVFVMHIKFHLRHDAHSRWDIPFGSIWPYHRQKEKKMKHEEKDKTQPMAIIYNFKFFLSRRSQTANKSKRLLCFAWFWLRLMSLFHKLWHNMNLCSSTGWRKKHFFPVDMSINEIQLLSFVRCRCQFLFIVSLRRIDCKRLRLLKFSFCFLNLPEMRDAILSESMNIAGCRNSLWASRNEFKSPNE